MTRHLKHTLILPLVLVLSACAELPSIDEQAQYIDRSGKSRQALITEFRDSFEMTCLPTYTGECDSKILTIEDSGFSYQHFDERRFHLFDVPPEMRATDVIWITQAEGGMLSANKADALRIYGFLMSIYRAGLAHPDSSISASEQSPPPQPVSERESSPATVDNAPPEIVVHKPDLTRGVSVVPRERTEIEGTVTDSDGVYRVIVNGLDVPFDNAGRFSTDVSLTEGENTVSIVAIDTEMKSSLKEFSIRRKTDITDTRRQERRLALVIGNSGYAHGNRLANPVNDARAIKDALEDLEFVVTVHEDGTQKTMKRAIDDFGRDLKAYDVGLFFFAGHGVQVNGNNYLIPVDARLESERDVEYDAVRADRVLAKMESAGVPTNIVILDACRDNPFERGWRRGVAGSGLAFMDAPSGSIIAYATSPGQTASDGTGRNGAYTNAILEHIGTENITIEQMFKRVRATIMRETDDRQVPWESTSLRGNFYFKRQ